jgi:DNA-3-methyladenine glycosylase II
VKRAVRHLSQVDPVLGGVIEQVGAYRLKRRREGTHFEHIARAIIYQQLSGKAAATIHGRLVDHLGGPPSPRALSRSTDEELRACGLSRQKIGYLRDMAEKAQSGEVPFEALHDLDDAEVIESLARVKGVGTWTAQMFLIFRLGRPDVLPATDLGIQKAVQRAYRMRKLPTPDRVLKVGSPWRPWASVASWYLWRSLDAP